jgi:hypothetical protein
MCTTVNADAVFLHFALCFEVRDVHARVASVALSPPATHARTTEHGSPSPNPGALSRGEIGPAFALACEFHPGGAGVRKRKRLGLRLSFKALGA